MKKLSPQIMINARLTVKDKIICLQRKLICHSAITESYRHRWRGLNVYNKMSHGFLIEYYSNYETV